MVSKAKKNFFWFLSMLTLRSKEMISNFKSGFQWHVFSILFIQISFSTSTRRINRNILKCNVILTVCNSGPLDVKMACIREIVESTIGFWKQEASKIQPIIRCHKLFNTAQLYAGRVQVMMEFVCCHAKASSDKPWC